MSAEAIQVGAAYHPLVGHVGRDEAVAVEGEVTNGVSRMHLPQLLVHPIIPHRDQAFLASADDFPVIHLDCGDPKLVGRERQGDFVSAEIVDPHP